MVAISIADPDGAGTKIAVDTRWYAEKDKPSISSSSVSTRQSAGGSKRSTPFSQNGRLKVTVLVLVRIVIATDPSERAVLENVVHVSVGGKSQPSANLRGEKKHCATMMPHRGPVIRTTFTMLCNALLTRLAKATRLEWHR